MSEFTAVVLLYGDYPELASRCLGSLRPHFSPEDVRIFCNAVSGRTRHLLADLTQAGEIDPKFVTFSEVNIYKYPAMRRMLYAADGWITTPYMMWFDDDSFIRPNATDRPLTGHGQTGRSQWMQRVRGLMDDVEVLGSLYTQVTTNRQREWVKTQPWYQGRVTRPATKFPQGAWWVVEPDLLRGFNWPIPELRHRGGDVMFGELCYQNDLRLGHFRHGVAINADARGVESASKRRGYDEPSIGMNYGRGGQT